MIAHSSFARLDIVAFLTGAYQTARRARRGRAIVSSYEALSAHVLHDIGLEPADLARAGSHPVGAAEALAESWKRRATMLARRELPPIEEPDTKGRARAPRRAANDAFPRRVYG